MVQVLDCTIRDGSYVNGFKWSLEDVTGIVKELDEAGIKYLEIGHGLGLGASRKIQSSYSDLEYTLAAVKEKNTANIGAFFIPGFGNKEDIKLFKDNGGDFIRVGTNVSKSQEAYKYIEYAKSLGLEVGYNFMKSYTLSPFDLCVKALEIEKRGADSIAIVDSAGGMLPKDVAHYVSVFKDCLEIKIGFHGHNNLLLANANNLAAVESGADIIDTTLMGMGRGAGNSQTESMIVILNKSGFDTGIDPLRVSNISEKYIMSYKDQVKGSDGIELALGYALFHDSYLGIIKKYAEEYSVDSRELIIETAKINNENPSDQLIEEIKSRRKEYEKQLSLAFLQEEHL